MDGFLIAKENSTYDIYFSFIIKASKEGIIMTPRKDRNKNIELFHMFNVICLYVGLAALGLYMLIIIIASIINKSTGPLINLLYIFGAPGMFLGYFLLELLIDKIELDAERNDLLRQNKKEAPVTPEAPKEENIEQ